MTAPEAHPGSVLDVRQASEVAAGRQDLRVARGGPQGWRRATGRALAGS